MKITNNFYVTKSRDGQFYTDIFDGTWRACNFQEEMKIERLYKIVKSKYYTELEKLDIINQFIADNSGKKIDTNEQIAVKTEAIIQNIMNFFSEFDFEPNYRFLNTFTYACNKNINEAKNYISRYFELTDSPMINSIKEKMKSDEFRLIYEGLKDITPSHKVNNRFKLYYGSQGTGKTTEALNETSTVVVCHSAMLPSDLMEDFKFEDGKAIFNPSALQKAMIEGTTILLDEINLLPFESLRFLQSILDGKKTISYKGKNIEIKDGFKIIGTMNLTVNGSTYALPEPLVDRCEEIRKFNLTAKDLVSAII